MADTAEPIDPITAAATTLETVRFEYEKVAEQPQPADLQDRIAWTAARARLGIELNKADADFARVVDAERNKAMGY